VTASAAAREARSWTFVVDGRRLREARRERGLSQEVLAGRAGISVTTVARLEQRQQASCRGRTLARLAAVLGEEPATFRLPPATPGIQVRDQP
jgi:transcriptional regulator with XRE-family HTH domain